MFRNRRLCLKSKAHELRACFVSFTPGFSQVTRKAKSTGNRLNGFQPKRLRNITRLKPGVNQKGGPLLGQGRHRSFVRFRPAATSFLGACFLLSAGWTVEAQSAPNASASDPPKSTITQNQQEPTSLELGAPVEREIASGQKHLYQLTLMPGQFIKVVVRQLSAEVRISLIPPDGKTIPVLDSFLHDPLVHVERVVDQAGTYRVEIYTRSKVPTGRYEIRLAELRPATENDRALEEAQESLEKAMVLMRTDKFTQAAPLWTRVIELRERVLGPDSLEVAEALSSLGVVYEHMSDYASAEPLLQRALRIKEKIRGPEHPAVADLLRSLGDLYLSKGDDVQAEELLQKARGIFERTQAETINLAALLRQLGEIYYARHDYQKRESYFRQSMAILERLLGPDHYHLVDSFAILGHVAYDAGDYAKAEPLFQKALTITEKALGPQNLKVAGFLNELAMLYSTTGNYQKAEELYQRALAIHELQGMADENARDTPLGLARLNAARGQLSEAVRFQT